MAKSSFIDLGREESVCEPCKPMESSSGKKRKYYPTLYIRGIEGLDLSTGEITFTAKGKVVMVEDRQTDRDGKENQECSVEIEVHSINPVSGGGASGGLEEAIDKIASKKAYDEERDDAEDDE